jgi:hypothetical protein
MAARVRFIEVFAIVFGLLMWGCGGGSSSNTIIPVSVTSPTTLPAATVNVAYSQQLTASGGNGSYTWALTAAVAGFSLSSSGLLTGTPTSTTTLSFPVKATDSTNSSNSGTATLTLSINPAAVTVTSPTTLPAATVNVAYTQQLTASGGSGSYTWTLTAAVAGFSVSSSGLLTGTPISTTTLSFAVKAADSTNSSNSGTATLSLTVNPAHSQVSIITTTLPAAAVNVAYSEQLSATGGSGSYTWTLTTPVTGFSLSSSGLLSGTPTSPVPLSFQVKATDVSNSSNYGTATLALTVNPAVSVATLLLPPAIVNDPYSQQLTAAGGSGSYTWTLTVPVAGFSLSGSGLLTGTPSTPGSLSFQVQATDASNSSNYGTSTLTLTVNASGLTITTTSLLNPMVGESYNQALHYVDAGGTLPVTWSVISGSLPAGFTLDPNTGAITGTATSAEVGTTAFTVRAQDSTVPNPNTAMQAFSLTITTATACGSGSEALLNGQYAMTLTGFDASGPVGMLASFKADGTGKITAGFEDINSTGASGVQADVPVLAGSSSYSVGSDHRGCLTLATSTETRVFRIAVGIIKAGVATSGRSIEFDTTGTNTTGSFQIQDSSGFSNGALAGTYTFTADSPLIAGAGGGFFSAIGVLKLNGTTVTGFGDINSNGTLDPGNAGYPAMPMTFTAGTYNIGPNGRGTMSFTIPTTPTPTTINAIVYVLNGSQMDLLSSDPQSATSTLFSGFVGRQSGGPYSVSSLNQTSVLISSGQTVSGAGSPSGVQAGIFSPDSFGNFSFSGDQNSGGITGTVTTTGTYTVAANGRVLLTNAGTNSPVTIMYMVLPGWAYALATDKSAMIGFMEPQSGEPFTNASLNGTFSFATIVPVVAASSWTVGVVTYDGNGNLTETFDVNDNGFLSLGNVITGTYAVSANGRVVTPATGITQRVTYIKDSSTITRFDYSSAITNPTIVVMDQ